MKAAIYCRVSTVVVKEKRTVKQESLPFFVIVRAEIPRIGM